MPGFGDLVQKAFYLGVGLAATAGEKATEKLGELRSQAQKLADELVAKGEMTAEEAKRFVDDMVQQAQQPTVEPVNQNSPPPHQEPRRIEIVEEEETPRTTPSNPVNQPPTGSKTPAEVEEMRRQVQQLQEELRRLQRN